MLILLVLKGHTVCANVCPRRGHGMFCLLTCPVMPLSPDPPYIKKGNLLSVAAFKPNKLVQERGMERENHPAKEKDVRVKLRLRASA